MTLGRCVVETELDVEFEEKTAQLQCSVAAGVNVIRLVI